MREKIQYYDSFSQDIVQSKNQDYSLPEDYQWIRPGFWHRLGARLVYGAAIAVGYPACKLGLWMTIRNRKILRQCDGCGYFLYANHTQPVGDVVLPAFLHPGKRIYTVVSTANLGIPIIGRILPALGALPIPDTIRQMKQFLAAVTQRIAQGNCVVIYPEAHVWPYYTKIRPFPASSFRFPVETDSPAFAMTTTYQKRPWGKRPRITVYVDGPFRPDPSLPPKARQAKLQQEVRQAMERRSQSSTYAYIHYQKKGDSME